MPPAAVLASKMVPPVREGESSAPTLMMRSVTIFSQADSETQSFSTDQALCAERYTIGMLFLCVLRNMSLTLG